MRWAASHLPSAVMEQGSSGWQKLEQSLLKVVKLDYPHPGHAVKI